MSALFDQPAYYDLLLHSSSGDEARFLQGCFERYATRPVRRVFEPACGSGRLLLRLAKRGFAVSGFDLSRRAVDYCNERLRRHALPPAATVQDVTRFRLQRKADAAFNLVSSFQCLLTQHSAVSHLRCMAASLVHGGVYVIGLQLLPSRGGRICVERWAARRGGLRVRARLWTKSLDRHRRREVCGIDVVVTSPRRRRRSTEEMMLRTYTVGQMARLIRSVPQFEIAATYDFRYDLDNQAHIDDRTQDAVYVLRRR